MSYCFRVEKKHWMEQEVTWVLSRLRDHRAELAHFTCQSLWTSLCYHAWSSKISFCIITASKSPLTYHPLENSFLSEWGATNLLKCRSPNVIDKWGVTLLTFGTFHLCWHKHFNNCILWYQSSKREGKYNWFLSKSASKVYKCGF